MFCRDMGWNDEDEAVEAREAVCNTTDIFPGVCRRLAEVRVRLQSLRLEELSDNSRGQAGSGSV